MVKNEWVDQGDEDFKLLCEAHGVTLTPPRGGGDKFVHNVSEQVSGNVSKPKPKAVQSSAESANDRADVDANRKL